MLLQISWLNQRNIDFIAEKIGNKNNVNTPNIQRLKRDTVSFKGVNKMSMYAALPVEEKRKIIGALNHILHKETELLLTIIGHKPSSSTSHLTQAQTEILIKHKKIFESENIKIRGYSKNIEVFHIPKFTEVVEKNIDIYRKRLGMKKANSAEIVDSIVNKGTVSDEVLDGLTLGYPKADAILYKVLNKVLSALFELSNINEGKYPAHEKVLAKVLSVLDPDLVNKIKKSAPLFKKGTPGYNQCRPFVGLKPVIDNDIPKQTGSNSKACPFSTWDSKNPEVIEIEETIRQGEAKAKELFKRPKDILNYFLVQK